MLKTRNHKAHSIEPWRETQLLKFVTTLTTTVHDLERAYKEEKLFTIAWLTRNLLELSVWVDFCNLSAGHARRFRDDTMKDLHGLGQAIQKLGEHQHGERNANLDGALNRLATFAQPFGIDKLTDDFTRVSAAAHELGRGREFLHLNKILSKFAHPTAWAVHNALLVDFDAGFRDMFLKDGVVFAVDSLSAVRTYILDFYPHP